MECIVSKWSEKEGNELILNGLVRINPNKPEFGSLMIINSSMTVNSGFVNKRNKVGFVTGEITVLEDMVEQFRLREGVDFSKAVGPHKIVTLEILESDVPENQGYREKINPSTEDTLTKDGEAIWWKTEVVSESSDLVDTLIQHDVATAEVDTATEEFTGAKAETTKAK